MEERVMYILVGEMVGDEGDYYTRPSGPLLVSKSKEALERWWKDQPRPSEDDMPFSLYSDEGDESRDDPREITSLDGRTFVYISYYIEEIPIL